MSHVRRRAKNGLEKSVCSLISTALGREKADIVVENTNLIDVDSGEVIENFDVAIKRGRIALIGKANHTVGNNSLVIDGTGKYLVPGFLDGHVHVESSMVTLTQFARAVLPRGTTGIFIDPHEIANVLGLNGVKLMLKEARKLPLKVFATVPSCVPAAPNFETTGTKITVEDIRKALTWNEVVGLGEVMDYPGVLRCDKNVLAKIQTTLEAGKIVEGHADSLLDERLAAYAAAGISSCHESTTTNDGVQRLRLGMCTMIREGSASRDLAEVIKCVTRLGLNPRHAVLVTDDRDPETLLNLGHMDHLVKRAIEEGTDPIVAIQMVTINTAEHFGLSKDLGSVAPGKIADLLILNDIQKVNAKTVMVNGQIVAQNGKLLADLSTPKYPLYARNSVHLKRRLEEKDLVIRIPKPREKVKVNIIGVGEDTIVTKHLQEHLEVEEEKIKADIKRDITKVAVVERHRLTGNIGLGLVHGLGLRKGAVASSVAHDSHNIIVVGVNDVDMTTAVNAIVDLGGGFVVANNGKPVSLLPLPIAGLMSDESIEKVSEQIAKLRKVIASLGCQKPSLLMTLSFLALPVIPELRITDLRLVDTRQFHFVNVLAE